MQVKKKCWNLCTLKEKGIFNPMEVSRFNLFFYLSVFIFSGVFIQYLSFPGNTEIQF